MIANRKPASSQPHVGVGLYSLSEASRIVGATPSRVSRWVNPRNGLVSRALNPDEKTLTFIELMEVFFVKMFRDEGVSLQTIRKAACAAASRFNTEYPFSVKRFDTDGRTIFATLIRDEEGKELVEDLRKGQLVFDAILKPFFKKLDYRGSFEVARYWPQEKSGRVVIDPKRNFGKPIDSETGVPTRSIYDAVKAGGGQDVETVARWLDVPVAAVNAAVKFEQSLVA